MPKTAEIGRFGEPMKRVALQDDATVQDLLNAAGLTLSESEQVCDSDSNTVNLTDTVEHGESYYLTQKNKNGC
jgi:hypothetical protein